MGSIKLIVVGSFLEVPPQSPILTIKAPFRGSLIEV